MVADRRGCRLLASNGDGFFEVERSGGYFLPIGRAEAAIADAAL